MELPYQSEEYVHTYTVYERCLQTSEPHCGETLLLGYHIADIFYNVIPSDADSLVPVVVRCSNQLPCILCRRMNPVSSPNGYHDIIIGPKCGSLPIFFISERMKVKRAPDWMKIVDVWQQFKTTVERNAWGEDLTHCRGWTELRSATPHAVFLWWHHILFIIGQGETVSLNSPSTWKVINQQYPSNDLACRNDSSWTSLVVDERSASAVLIVACTGV